MRTARSGWLHPAVWLLTLAGPASAAAQKTDIVVLANGDRVTCEIQSLERGLIEVKTDSLGTLRIEWEDVSAITSTALFEVELLNGEIHYGQISTPSPGAIVVGDPGQPPIGMPVFFRMTRLERGFWQRLDGHVDAGGSFTQSSGVSQTTVSAGIGSRRPGFEWEITYDGTVTTTGDEDDGSSRHNVGAQYVRLLPDRWMLPISGRFERNQDLGYDLRSSAGVGIGRSFVRSRNTVSWAGGGIAINREVPVEGESTTNVEAVTFVSYENFAYDFPNVNVKSRLATYFSLNDPGRFRLGTQVEVRRDLLSTDIYVAVTVYDDYDNRPPGTSGVKNDFGFTFSFGVKF